MSVSPHVFAAATYNARCARSLLSVLSSLGPGGHIEQSSPNPVLLFALAPSSTTPPKVLSDIVSSLTQLYPEHVGCISAPLPYRHFDPRVRSGPSCSLAYMLVNGVSFRSMIPGRAEAQVGRWHAARQRPDDANSAIEESRVRIISELSGKVNWEDVWDRSASLLTCSTPSSQGDGLESETLPDTLRNLDPSTVDNILYFSDKAPEGLATMLEKTFPQADKLSLIASSTPFITGRPVTLFHNGSILSHGAAGIAFSSSSSSPLPAVNLSFPPLLALSSDLNITSSEGNLILSLDFGNPTQLLLNAVQKHGLASSHTTWVDKEDEFYVGVIDPSSQQLYQLHRINAGDPSRGAIALDSASVPVQGSTVRLYHLPRDHVLDGFKYPANSPGISLFVAPEVTSVAVGSESELPNGQLPNGQVAISDLVDIPNTFFAASENGFTLSHGAQGPWKCVVPGAHVGLSWSRGM